MYKVEGYCIDVESNGLFFKVSKAWTIVLKDIENPNKKLIINPSREGIDESVRKFKEWHNQYENPFIIGHYILGYDFFVLKKILNIDFTCKPDTLFGKPCRFIDTLYLSQYINPDIDGHSLEDWGLRLGLEKIDYRAVAIENGVIAKDSEKGSEFLVYHPMLDVYCERDVDLNILLFTKLWERFSRYYVISAENQIPTHYQYGQKAFYLMSCQEFSGWKFDQDAAAKLSLRIEGMMAEIESIVLPQLPPRKLKKGEEKDYTMPAKPFKKDGSFSNHMLNFIEKHKGIVKDNFFDGFTNEKVIEFYGKDYIVKSKQMLDIKLPMEIKDSSDLKEWFKEQGWVPTLFNYQRGPDGKPVRDPKGKLIQTSPKLQDTGKLCPNLEKLDGEIPKQVVRFLSLRNRHSVLNGWRSNYRLSIDGRIGASRTGITNTHRQKHSVIVNCPKASDKVLLGKEFRSLWTSEDNCFIAAGDAAALEGRVMGHYTYRYDNGKTANDILNGDPHSKNAFAFFKDELYALGFTEDNYDKDHPFFKPYRDRSKNGFYALLYGCSATKLASVLGLPEKKGNSLLDAFWKANPALSKLKENVENFWIKKGDKRWLPAIDGRRLMTRKKSALLNTIFQSCGAIAMDYACCFLDEWMGGIRFDKDCKPCYLYKGYLVQRIGYMHDELEFESNDENIAKEVSDLISKAIEKAGEYLTLSVPLAGEGKVGKNWCDVH